MSTATYLTDPKRATTADADASTLRVTATTRHVATPSPSIDLKALPNLLDCDGIAVLIQNYLSEARADELFSELVEQVAWEQHTVTMFGKTNLADATRSRR